MARRLDPDQFPHPPKQGSGNPPATVANVEHLLAESGIEVRFDVIKKRLVFQKADGPCSMVDIISLSNFNGINATWLSQFLHEIGVRNPRNPVADWIESRSWDGTDRLPEIYATVETVEDYPETLKKALLWRWLLSATAAALAPGRFSCRGVLTLQGPQGIGKTSWIAQLMPKGELRDQFIKRDHHLDGGNKDSILGAISHWITEIGELDSSFRKDVARLKGFLTNDCDKVRPPYGRAELEYDRRTVFAATVNDEHFLVDNTGNSRFWTLSVDRLDFKHTIDMQQVFAQLRLAVQAGTQWWLTDDEDKALAEYNLRHRSVNSVAERIMDNIDMDCIRQGIGKYLTASEMLKEIGVTHPSNVQAKDCGQTLRELLGTPKRIQGWTKWRVPLIGDSSWRPAKLAPNGQPHPKAAPEDRF